MLTAKNAYALVKQHNPAFEVIACYEYDTFYAFGLVPADLEDGDRYAGSIVHIVDKKDSKYSVVHFMDMPDEPSTEIDITTLT